MRGISDVTLMLGAAILAIAALWHVYWLLGGTAGLVSAVPERNSAPLFVPGKLATAIVSCAIAAVAVLYGIAAGGMTPPRTAPGMIAGLLGLAGVVFIARAIGDFNHVGFFNRGGMTPFAVADRKVYAPLCLFLGLAGIFAAGLRFL